MNVFVFNESVRQDLRRKIQACRVIEQSPYIHTKIKEKVRTRREGFARILRLSLLDCTPDDVVEWMGYRDGVVLNTQLLKGASRDA